MPSVPTETPIWINALIVAGAWISAIISGVVIKARAAKKDPPAETSRIVAVGGQLQDSRVIETLVTQLGHNERTMRDSERSAIENTHAIERATGIMVDICRTLEARSRREEAEHRKFVAAMDGKRAEGRNEL